MVPDDEICITVIDLRKMRCFVFIKMSSPPLDVSSASHQGCHRPLYSLMLSFGLLDSSSGGVVWFLSKGSGLGHGRGAGSGGYP